MEDPRETAWQSRCANQSRTNAIRVGFAAAYTQAVPHSLTEHYYNTKLISLIELATNRSKLRGAARATEDEENAPSEEWETVHGHDIVPECVPETVGPSVNGMGRVKATTKRKTRSNPASLSKRKRTEVELLLHARGLDTESNGSGVAIVDGLGKDVIDRNLPASTLAPSGSTKPPVTQETKKHKGKLSANTNKRISLRSRLSAPSSAENFYPKPISPNKTGIRAGTGQEIPLHISGTIEVIFNRYPTLHKLASTRKGKKIISSGANREFKKIPDINKLILLCNKARRIAAPGKAMKTRTENGIVGRGGGLVFLRRNVVKVGARTGARV